MMLWSDERIVSAVKFSNIAISDIPATKATLLMQEVRDEYEQRIADLERMLAESGKLTEEYSQLIDEKDGRVKELFNHTVVLGFRIAALEQEVAMLKAHNGLISAELGRTKQALYAATN